MALTEHRVQCYFPIKRNKLGTKIALWVHIAIFLGKLATENISLKNSVTGTELFPKERGRKENTSVKNSVLRTRERALFCEKRRNSNNPVNVNGSRIRCISLGKGTTENTIVEIFIALPVHRTQRYFPKKEVNLNNPVKNSVNGTSVTFPGKRKKGKYPSGK